MKATAPSTSPSRSARSQLLPHAASHQEVARAGKMSFAVRTIDKLEQKASGKHQRQTPGAAGACLQPQPTESGLEVETGAAPPRYAALSYATSWSAD